jgi:hypothetical protein
MRHVRILFFFHTSHTSQIYRGVQEQFHAVKQQQFNKAHNWAVFKKNKIKNTLTQV